MGCTFRQGWNRLTWIWLLLPPTRCHLLGKVRDRVTDNNTDFQIYISFLSSHTSFTLHFIIRCFQSLRHMSPPKEHLITTCHTSQVHTPNVPSLHLVLLSVKDTCHSQHNPLPSIPINYQTHSIPPHLNILHKTST